MPKSEYKRFAHIGPGGMKCVCCAPAPGAFRRVVLRAAKKAYRRQLDKDANATLRDLAFP